MDLKHLRKPLAVLLFFSLPALASNGPWHGYTQVTHLYPATGGYFFLVSDPLPDYSSCDNSRRFSIPLDHPNYEAMVSTLMR